MNKRLPAFLNVVLLGLVVVLALGGAPLATAVPSPDDDATEDILHMADGRELHGRVIEETPDEVIFELVIRNTTIRTKVTYSKDEIAEIHRGVAIGEDAGTTRTRTPSKRTAATSRPEEDDQATYGARRAASNDQNLPSFYIIPLKGQMGTDIHIDVYKSMVEDIRMHDPDIIVIEMECRDNEDVLYSLLGREEKGIADFDAFRELINLFRDELGDIRQVVWIKDSVGVSSVVAMAWDEIYMAPDARFGGLNALQDIGFEKWSDEDVRGKMTAAFMSFVKGFLEYGGYAHELADAMVRPSYQLSGTWKGREVVWTLDTEGQYIVDSSDKATAEFRAKSAEDLCISDGTVENLDDMALLLGMREYRVLEGKGEQIHTEYTEDWRRALENCKVLMQDYEQYMGWAGGDDTLKYLGRAKSCIEKVIAAMDRYEAVETRLAMELGLKRFDLVTLIEQMKERIRALRQSRRGGRGGGGGGIGGG